MAWIFVPAKERDYKEAFRLCHECGGEVHDGEAHVITVNGRWVFHPACGLAFQVRELKLQTEIVIQLQNFIAKCKGKKKLKRKEKKK